MSSKGSPGASPAWRAEELADPHARADKAERVRRMFAAIAGSYDFNNRVHSMWRDQAWRRYAVRAARLRAGDVVADVACGTGDLTRLFAAARGAAPDGGAGRGGEGPGLVLGIDFTREMLDVAERRKRADAAARDGARGRVLYVEGDALALPLGSASVDVLSIAFGLRNVADPARAVGEFARVLRPGGRLVVLEFDTPRTAVLGTLANFYTRHIMPRTATWLSGDRSGAYRYLPASVATFLTREKLAAIFAGAGLEVVEQRPLTAGICVCHVAVKPGR